MPFESGTTDLGANIGSGSGGGGGVTSLNTLTGALTLVPGAGIVITPGVGTITIASTNTGTVTSVGLALPAAVFSISGSPVTSSGTLTGSFINQAANTVFAGPASGGAATPTFRALTLADLPAGTGTVTSVTGTLPIVSSGGNTPNISLNYDGTANSTLFLNASNNLAVQYMSLSTAGSNYFWGYAAGSAITSGFGNEGIGTNALLSVTTGNYNIGIGDLAGQLITTGSANIAIGGTTLGQVTTASNNIAIGRSALNSNTGINNTAVGFAALQRNTTGTNNTAIGFGAANDTGLEVTSTFMTYLGNASGATVDGLTNSTALGSLAKVTASNQIMLGNSAVTSVTTAVPSVLYNSASPMNTLGQIEYFNSGVSALNIGTTGQLLTVVAGVPAWQTLSASSISGVITVPNGGTGDSSFNPYAVITGGATSTSNLQQVSGVGFSGQVLMSNGAGVLPTWQTPSITNGNPSGAQFITSGTTFTTPSTVNAATLFRFTLIGGGGGGAGIAAATNNASAGGGGGAVGVVILTGLAASTAYTIAIGAAGLGGAAGANAGAAGGNTTLTIGSTTYIAGFGSGATATATADGGAGGACTNTTISITGGNGGSVGVAGTATIAGYGGQAPGYSAQTAGKVTTGPGANGTGYGAGGAGAKCSTATAEAGGNGAAGAIFAEWFN
jgi:hypothetical protein